MPLSVNWSVSHTATRRSRVRGRARPETSMRLIIMPAATAASTAELPAASASR